MPDVTKDVRDFMQRAALELAIEDLDESFGQIPDRIEEASAKAAEEAHPHGSRRLNIAMGYGGRQEIVDAAKDLVAELAEGGVPADDIPDQIDADALAQHMYSSDIPDPDLLIRTSGEMRLSNFLLWQLAYAEIYVTDVLWPDFGRLHLYEAIRDYQTRERRFGRVD